MMNLSDFGTHRVARLVGVVVSSVLLFALAGCGQSSSTSDAKSSDTSSSTTTDGSGSDSADSPDPSGSSDSSNSDSKDSGDASSSDKQDSSSANAASKICTTANLRVKITAGQGGGAGSTYPYLVFTNAGSSSCVTQGYPGVSLQSNGKQIGAAAQRDKSVKSTAITLKPGASAHAVLRITQAGAFDKSVCSPKQADSLLIYPPDQLTSIRVKTSDYTGCASAQTKILQVRALEAGKA